MPELTSISTAIVPAPLPALPEKKKGGRPRGLGRRGVLKEAERQMVQAAPEVLKKYWAAVEKGLEAGEKWAADAVSQTFGYTKAAGGATIIQAMQVNNAGRGQEGAGRRSFESIIRKLETEAESDGPLAQPDDDDIIDAETDEDDEGE